MAPSLPAFAPVATYSIVARDPVQDQLGVAVQSHHFAVGSVAPFARAGVGAGTIQSFASLIYATEGPRLMQEGASAGAALRRLLAQDHHMDYRQAGMIDTQGDVVAHTGSLCIDEAGHCLGDEYACLGNMLLKDGTWDAMGRAYEAAQGDFPQRLLAALEAAQAQGGDLRGRRSAAIMVVSGTATGDPAQDMILDLRVEDHPTPVRELRRLVTLKAAYTFNTLGGHHLRHGEYDQAIRAFTQAEALAPDEDELVFWRAVALINAGHEAQAEALLNALFHRAPHWSLLLIRVAKSRFLPDDPALIARLLSSRGDMPPAPPTPDHSDHDTG
ncbi:Uncharacterized conserved protein, Ntn-hydrolase superfamily [Ectothiorhodospira magna]|uniref:Uncharacterized conserved protein, Ntn-hydrolase superfamily n=1 Tax=Ectothiorhodospira magna TaxID=867345 RepID=A0A1H9BCV4_9GAMM|nr:DUF1028 domain-containing protein [Ectothiorhodospira magna]SEP86826.1 Uncharacterized conserved protein, Ntn-hydrolase superfamily [Ectothiorhodospira magna]